MMVVLSSNTVFLWCGLICILCISSIAFGYFLANHTSQKAVNWSGGIWRRNAKSLNLSESSKVTPLYPHIEWWKAGTGTEVCQTPPKPGQTYAIRKTAFMPNGYLGIQLVGITVRQGGHSWEPYWNAAAFSPLKSESLLK